MCRTSVFVIAIGALLVGMSCQAPAPEVEGPVALAFEPYDGELPSHTLAKGQALSPRPSYLVYTEDVGGELMLELQFSSESYRGGDARSLRGGMLYCVVTHPDGETVKLAASIPARTPRVVISFPLTKRIPWRPRAPAACEIRFLYETGKGVGEYVTTFGYNRITPQEYDPDRAAPQPSYFKLERESIYIRGAYESHKGRRSSELGREFFDWLKGVGFNIYVTDRRLTPDEVNAAAEVGVMVAWIIDDMQPDTGYAEGAGESEIPASILQSPSWMGESCIYGKKSAAYFAGEVPLNWTEECMGFQKGRRHTPTWYAMLLPDCMESYDRALHDLGSGGLPGWMLKSRLDVVPPTCIAYFGSRREDCAPPEVDLYELVNLIRRREWCAGFIIPLELYDRLQHQRLMTDDFLIFDIEGFPYDVPVRARRGSILRIPIRYANLKPAVDRSGAIYWWWEESGEEGRINYGEAPIKGIAELPPLEIQVPNMPGGDRLRFEVVGFDGFVQAFNYLDVVVE